MKLRVTRLSHGKRVDGRLVVYNEGDVFNGSERELKAFSDRLEVVEVSTSKHPAKDGVDRDDLVKQANELGIKFHPNIGVEKLQAKIDEALNGDSEA